VSDGKVSAEEILGLIREEGIVDVAEEFGAGDDLFEAGLDSMAVMQLLVAAGERFGVNIDAGDVTRENFANCETLAEMIRGKG
jgi:acyl carrier protein